MKVRGEAIGVRRKGSDDADFDFSPHPSPLTPHPSPLSPHPSPPNTMLVSDWPHTIAHVDADCFFASCELARRPDLRSRPVCVLSSQDACVVAKTHDAKAAGISTGMPVWEATKR